MEPAVTEDLTALLGDALRSVVVQSRSGTGHIVVSEYRNNLIALRTTYDPSLRHVTHLYQPVIKDASVRGALLELIRRQLHEYIRGGKMHSASIAIKGGLSGGYTVEDLMENLVRTAILLGVESAVREFANCVDGDRAPFQECLLLAGIRVERKIEVLKGVWLIPLTETEHLLPSLRPDTYHEFIGARSQLRTLLRLDCSAAPILHRPSASYTLQSGPSDHFNTTYPVEDLGVLLRALSLACGSSVEPAMQWSHIGIERVFDFSKGSSGFSYVRTLTTTRAHDASEEQIRTAYELYRGIADAPSEVADALDVPTSRLIKAYGSGSPVDRMIDVGIALESLYLAKDGPGELSFRLGIRAAWLLGGDPDERKQIMKQFKAIYDMRSRAVHTGKLPPRAKVGDSPLSMEELTTLATDLCRSSIVKIIEDKKLPGWEALVTGDPAA